MTKEESIEILNHFSKIAVESLFELREQLQSINKEQQIDYTTGSSELSENIERIKKQIKLIEKLYFQERT